MKLTFTEWAGDRLTETEAEDRFADFDYSTSHMFGYNLAKMLLHDMAVKPGENWETKYYDGVGRPMPGPEYWHGAALAVFEIPSLQKLDNSPEAKAGYEAAQGFMRKNPDFLITMHMLKTKGV